MKALVLILNNLPLGFLGCYGNDWIDTPALDRLAAEGVVFDRHYSDCPEYGAARRAWRTGRHAFPDIAVTAPPPEKDLLQSLRDAGVEAVVVREDHPHLPREGEPGWSAADSIAGDDALLQALDRLAAADHGLLWVELASLLPPWACSEEYFDRYLQMDQPEDAEPVTPLTELPAAVEDDAAFLRLQSTYGALVAELDGRLEELVEELTRRELLDDMLLVVTTDRGMVLGDHGGDVRPSLHSELVHLPLLVRWPGVAEPGRRVPVLTQPADLMPTLLAAFGLPAAGVEGHNLLPFLAGAPEPVRQFACSALQVGDALEGALRSADWSFLLSVRGAADDLPQLYVQPDDRWEVNNVIQHHPELAEELERTLREALDPDPERKGATSTWPP